MKAASPPRQMERENEMIVISQLLLFFYNKSVIKGATMPLYGTCAHDAENKETFKEGAWGQREWCIPSLAAGPGAPMASDVLRSGKSWILAFRIECLMGF